MRYVPVHGTWAMYCRRCRCDACYMAAKEYRRARRGGLPTAGWTKVPAEDRFWAKVAKSETCWEWTGYTNPSGYGTFNPDRAPVLAHRYAWAIANGAIPEGLFVCHRCDNPRCVRFDHLFLGTGADNMRDMAQKGRHVGTRRLTASDVATIRTLASAGMPQAEIGRRMGVSQSAVSLVVNGRRLGAIA